MPVTFGSMTPKLHLPIPDQRGRDWVERLARTECPALTARRARRQESSGAPHDPVVWVEAKGVNVRDADGNVYVDFTSGFGAAAIGHRHPRVTTAVHAQTDQLLHALGDLHPSDRKITLLERLAELAPFPNARVMLGLSGSDAVEAALKSATLATGRPGVVAFEGAYHGLAYGPLATCGYRPAMRQPFASQLNPHVRFAPWPTTEDVGMDRVAACLDDTVGALLLEPIQGRAGVRIPPRGFLARVCELARSRGALVIVDEIQTGLGRTGQTWRSGAEQISPDLICVGKALGGGLPMSACLGRAEVMAAWGSPEGEALHTGTFFGHPLGAAAALATLDVMEEEGLTADAERKGKVLEEELSALRRRHSAVTDVRAAGLMIGVELAQEAGALAMTRRLLERGYLTLPAGSDARVVQLLPPLTVSVPVIKAFVAALDAALTSS